MKTMSRYLSEVFWQAVDAKTPEEKERLKIEYKRRVEWYQSQNLGTDQEPDGSRYEFDMDGPPYWTNPEDRRGPELWPEGWKPK